MLSEHLKIGTPYALSEFIEMIVLFSYITLLDKVSENDLTIYNIAVTMWVLFTFLIEGFQKGVVALASNCLGARKENLLPRLIRSMFIANFIFAVITALPLLIFVKQLLVIGFNIDNMAILRTFQQSFFALWICMIIVVFEYACMSGILTSGGDTKFVTIIRLTGVFFMTIVIFRLFALGKLNVVVVWWISVVKATFNGICYYLRYKYGQWKHKIV